MADVTDIVQNIAHPDTILITAEMILQMVKEHENTCKFLDTYVIT